jgi:hypothetical protein
MNVPRRKAPSLGIMGTLRLFLAGPPLASDPLDRLGPSLWHENVSFFALDF